MSVCQLAYFLNEIRHMQRYLLIWRRYLPENFLRHSWDVFALFSNNCKFLVCLSVLQLAYLLTEIRPIQIYLLVWNSYLSELFQRHSWDIFSSTFAFGKIWHEASLDPCTKIQEELIRQTMLGPCLGHKRAKFCLFTVSLLLHV